jgi:hypothetical protein
LDGALALLRHRYGLRRLIHPLRTEHRQLVALRNWVHARWDHHSSNLPRRFDALTILDEAGLGRRFRCVEYALVLAQVYRALGWCARIVRVQGKKGAHALTEVYSRQHRKWILMDGQHAAHVTRAGVPLDVLELKRAIARGDKGLKAHVAGFPVDYVAWMSGLLDFLMVPREMTYGRELDTLVVLTRPGQSAPLRKPAYLRRTRYLATSKTAQVYPSTCRPPR